MSWTAIVPLKPSGERKSRLAARLSPAARARLSDWMAGHVLGCLARIPAIARTLLLSPAPFGPTDWRPDRGRGLNAELAAARADLADQPLLVIHADLPLLAPADLEALLAAAGDRVAIAPDRHDSGTNALAIPDSRPFAFAFGADSFAAHRAVAADGSAVVRRAGLAMDVDTPADLDAAVAAGLRLPELDG